MRRLTFRGDNGEAYIDFDKTDMRYAIQRFAELEDAVEAAEQIQESIVQNETEKNMLELHPRAKFEEIGDYQKEAIQFVRIKFSELYYLIDSITDGNPEFSEAMNRLEEAQFWVIKGISRK